MSSRHRTGRLQRMTWQLLKQLMQGMLRLLFRLTGRRTAEAGFVFPTTVLLVLMVILTSAALTYRAFSRSEQVITQRQQQEIANIATPAIDRAKSKIEFLFTEDPRFPQGVPGSDELYSLMATERSTGFVGYAGNFRPLQPQTGGAARDFYTFPDEERININSGNDFDPSAPLDNAWVFPFDVNGDNNVDPGELIGYSILVDDTGPEQTIATDPGAVTVDGSSDQEKANALVTRTGPVATTQAVANCPGVRAEAAGWQEVDQQIQKNFQVNVFVSNGSEVNPIFEAIEFQHSREAEASIKWGAWFRYDLEIYPGGSFNWNGAMHTDGSLIVNGPLASHMVSSHNSCIYTQQASEITIGAVSDDGSFQGQAIKGNIGTNTSNSEFHIWQTSNRTPPVLGTRLADATDSVDGATPANAAMNPLVLFSEDIEEHLSPLGGAWNRDPAWDTSPFVEGDRIFNDPAPRPFVDDFYRADNRWGPRPQYGSTDTGGLDLTVRTNAGSIGEPIAGAIPAVEEDLIEPQEGFDGYWERQAIASGMRVVVGQRLELGNTFGWNSDPTDGVAVSAANRGENDPLYPAQASKGQIAAANAVVGGDHEYLQRRSLRDNLAAVQGMVVYHYEVNQGQFPAACIALTAHPGTEQTIINSRTFDTWLGSGSIKTDFLTGTGTNGWEFDFPRSVIESNIASGDLRTALENLAHFAGDPNGGAPSFVPVQDGDVHPYPYMAMWGDFSPLRRIFDDVIAAGIPYNSDSTNASNRFSPADAATMQSAACTLGMLAYNVQEVEAEFTGVTTSGTFGTPLNRLATNLAGLTPPADDTSTGWRGALVDSFITPPETFPDDLTAAEQEELQLFDALTRWGHVKRGREFGFLQPPAGAICVATDFPGVTDAAALVSAICDVPEVSRYPSLFYLFPVAPHDQTASGTQPVAEPYIAESQAGEYIATENGTYSYRPVNLGSVALTPQSETAGSWETPTFSETDPLDDTSDPLQAFRIQGPTNNLQVTFLDKGIADGREQLSVRVLDMDLDALTSESAVAGGDFWLADNETNQGEGVVYAFREDAVREDEIVRPSGGGTNCTDFTGGQFGVESNAGCRMEIDPTADTFQDPPLTDIGISLKPVDFAPDPDRRSYGFRLRTASTEPADFSNTYARQSGMTFVTDNSAFILGDFNLHSTANTVPSIVEEFTENVLITPSVGYGAPFYNARTTPNLTEFAVIADQDRWRPVEILCDGLTILSRDFRDGALEDAFLEETDTVEGGELSSYQNLNRPQFSVPPTGGNPNWSLPENWVHEDPNDPTSPIWVDRNGTFYVNDTGTPRPYHAEFTASDEWVGFSEMQEHRNNLQDAVEGYVNAVFVSGIVPSRPDQNYGGLHNYPRFLENWAGTNLYIAGSFLQLNFATAATGPYEQDAWEPTDNPDGTEPLGYYINPVRRWGYDVGLLYVPPSPAAERFIRPGRVRDEVYRELPVDDPYIVNLRCAVAGGTPVFNNPAGICP